MEKIEGNTARTAQMTDEWLSKQEKKLIDLLAKAREIKNAYLKQVNNSGRNHDYGIHFADKDNKEEDIDMNMKVASRAAEKIQKINFALQRMKNGEYEVCLFCSNKISRQRLEAVPYAHMCITCKRVRPNY